MMWILIQASEDGDPIKAISDESAAELLSGQCTTQLVDEPPSRFGDDDWDTNYWDTGRAILLKAQIVTSTMKKAELKPVPDFRGCVDELLDLAHSIICNGRAWEPNDHEAWEEAKQRWITNYHIHLGSTDD
jgi:hypothetical protein